MGWTEYEGRGPQLLIQLADDWHGSPYRVSVRWEGDLPEFVATVAVENMDSKPTLRVTGRYLRTGTASDGVPVYAWVPEDNGGK